MGKLPLKTRKNMKDNEETRKSAIPRPPLPLPLSSPFPHLTVGDKNLKRIADALGLTACEVELSDLDSVFAGMEAASYADRVGDVRCSSVRELPFLSFFLVFLYTLFFSSGAVRLDAGRLGRQL
jgi:hypothetical protein